MCVILPRNTEVPKRNASLIQSLLNLLLQGKVQQGIGGGGGRVDMGETGEYFVKRGPVVEDSRGCSSPWKLLWRSCGSHSSPCRAKKTKEHDVLTH